MENRNLYHSNIIVLMSTYNGVTFVEAQLKSILEQLPEGARILIRDDGSSDGTVSCIQAICDERITLSTGPNLGFVRSFFELMRTVPPYIDIIMFADQDDIWLPDKVRRTCEALAGREKRPTLYASKFQIVGPELQPICSSPHFAREFNLANALCENIVTGCTMALNRKGLELVRRGGDLGRIVAHDWWAYLVITSFGDLVYDHQETMLYRQHAHNLIGMNPGIKSQMRRLRILANLVGNINRQVSNLIETHGAELGEEQIGIIFKYFDFKRAGGILRFIFSLRRFRRALHDEVALRCAVAFTGLFRRRDLKDLQFSPEKVQ